MTTQKILTHQGTLFLLLVTWISFSVIMGCEIKQARPSTTPYDLTQLCKGSHYRGILLFDAHDHLTPGLSPKTIVQRMDEAGVGRIVLMANRGATNEDLIKALDNYPERFTIFVPAAGWGNVNTRLEFIDFAENLLRGGRFKGMGEFMIKHYPVSPQGGVGSIEGNLTSGDRDRLGRSSEAPMIDTPADSPLMRRMWSLAGRYQVPVIFHMETDDVAVAALERALADFPKVTFIWAHQNPVKTYGGRFEEYARKGDPELLRRLLSRYPNLYADISLGYETIFYRPEKDRILPQAWKALYEDFSDRFMIGLDNAYRSMFEQSFVRRAGFMRYWLDQLSPEAAERIGCINAHRIILRIHSHPSK